MNRLETHAVNDRFGNSAAAPLGVHTYVTAAHNQ